MTNYILFLNWLLLPYTSVASYPRHITMISNLIGSSDRSILAHRKDFYRVEQLLKFTQTRSA